MVTFNVDKRFYFEDKNLLNVSLEKIQKRISFEIQVPALKADAVKNFINMFALIDKACAQSFPKRLTMLFKIYIKSFRFPILFGIINSAQLAGFEISISEPQDALCIVFQYVGN